MITLGTGIGGAIVRDGHVERSGAGAHQSHRDRQRPHLLRAMARQPQARGLQARTRHQHRPRVP